MNINSRLFDRIRIGPSEAEAVVDGDAPRCNHAGCTRTGEFRAPMGRGREGQFFLFCMEHVKAYNATYNYFAGMDDEALAAYAKQEEIGHRPTWKLGVNSQAGRTSQRGRRAAKGESGEDLHDAFNLFGARNKQQAAQPESRVGVVARKALDTLGLDDTADAAAIKARYKELVKRFHPDANGGDRSREGTLQEILKAYQQLKSVGMV
ncbi:J domain-containing protein [Bosea sp. BH3]|uniref:J domain-containing protein n=1 Tax=Bosea sp. BH3 TaxID=2871701 RepID=UPI0021CB25F1|nr:J domain-containing protein [Bosea sp. BH3]MCU4178517.1 J domain-containing protein [Bosea sp. BH3]